MREGITFTVFALALMASCCCVNGCGDDSKSAADAAATLQTDLLVVHAEAKLSESDKVYLMVNLAHKELQLMLKGAVVWNYPLVMEQETSDELHEFARLFRGKENRIVRPLSEKHLFASKSRTPDSILAIVSEVTKFKPELLQREMPERFQLLWGDDLILDVRTDVQGTPVSKFKNTIVEIRRVLQRPLGEAYLSVKMDPVRALSLYRVAQPGLPTILVEP